MKLKFIEFEWNTFAYCGDSRHKREKFAISTLSSAKFNFIKQTWGLNGGESYKSYSNRFPIPPNINFLSRGRAWSALGRLKVLNFWKKNQNLWLISHNFNVKILVKFWWVITTFLKTIFFTQKMWLKYHNSVDWTEKYGL